ncbi:MAG: Na+/H+ antiporter subunit E [Rhodospirillaceae bacterium]
MARSIGLAITLFILWILMSGHTAPLLIGFGVASSILVAWIAHRMEVVDHEGFPIHLSRRAIVYWPWLIWEIFKANIDVAKIIVKKDMPISPIMFRTKASQETEVGQVTYANSITLTPGTISVAVGEGMIDVHALTEEAAIELQNGTMDRQVYRMEAH